MTAQPFYCSFCGKRDDEVIKLIAGPTVFICNECVVLCQDIICEETDAKHGPRDMIAADVGLRVRMEFIK